MATLTTTIAQARTTLLEASASFWTDAELLEHAQQGVKDLWRAILDLHQEHFHTVDITNVSIGVDATSLTGVPTDVFRVLTLEVRDLTTANSVQNLTFEPRDYNHPDFQAARAMASQSPSGCTVFFSVSGAGAPVGAPTIRVAPKLSTAVNLSLSYVRTLVSTEIETGDENPIPGESDHAIYAWIVAHARAKEREDRLPDPEWLAIYGTDKKSLLTALTPRQTQEPDYSEGYLEEYW